MNDDFLTGFMVAMAIMVLVLVWAGII